MSDRQHDALPTHITNPTDLPGGAAGFPVTTNLTQLKGAAIASDAGPSNAATPRTVTASDSPEVTALAAANVLLTAANALQTAANALLTTIDADTGNIATATQLIDDGIATVGAAVPAKGMAAAGSDGTNARLLRTDADGHVQVDVLSGGGTVGGALEATQGDVKTAVQLIDDAVATVAAAVPSKGMAAAVTDGTNARLLLGDTSGQAKTRPPSPGDAETITAILGADPVTAEMVAIDLDTVYVTVQGSVVANAGTNNRIVLFGEPRDTGAIAAIPGGDFTVMETNGPFRVAIAPQPVGMIYKKIGARKYFTDGGDDPVFTVIMRQRK